MTVIRLGVASFDQTPACSQGDPMALVSNDCAGPNACSSQTRQRVCSGQTLMMRLAPQQVHSALSCVCLRQQREQGVSASTGLALAGTLSQHSFVPLGHAIDRLRFVCFGWTRLSFGSSSVSTMWELEPIQGAPPQALALGCQ